MHERSVSPLELVDACLARIEGLEGRLNAVITLTADAARRRARELERELRAGRDRGPLHGIPIALKDLYETAGVRTTAGSRILAESVPARDAAAVERLRAAGAISLGKLNLHELAFGVTNDNPHYGATRNPWALDRSPGGSSGGSAAALAAGYCYGALGSDTGGSIRIPASLCGVVGLKPTYGRVSLRGVVPLAWTLDHAGPLARRVRDAAILLRAIAGYDAADPASADEPVDDYLADIEAGVAGVRVAVPRNHFFEDADPAVAAAVREAAGTLGALGAHLAEVSIDRADELAAAQWAILGTDAAALHGAHVRDRAAEIGPDVLER
ncbi:MAG: amidase, partial [Candidatus Limnocylindria bacterium]